MNQVARMPQNDKSNYMIQLDALRAIAVLGVLVYHFLPQDFILNSRFQWGPLGVKFFFVLSGFLITRILLRCKDLVEVENQSVLFTLKSFFARRILRLAPAYYLYLLVITILASNSIKDSLLWHLTYTSNFYFSKHGWVDYTSHFWSLSVEEQFYVFWALLIILLPRRYLLVAIISTIFIAPLFRSIFVGLGLTNGISESILTFACFDSLGLGALLAFFSYYRSRHTKAFTSVCFWIGLPLFIALNFIVPIYSRKSIILGSTAASMFFVWLINRAAQGFKGLPGDILSFQPLVYLGKISYGIYLYHLLSSEILYRLFTYSGLAYPKSVWLEFVLQTLLTVITASLSWHFFESPINALKKNFDYKKS
jgi:peptidoglycan/LPS O-acetylase OafA/YrhL